LFVGHYFPKNSRLTTTAPPADISTVLTKLDATAAAITQILDHKQADDEIRAAFNVLLTNLNTCKIHLHRLPNQAAMDAVEQKERDRSVVLIGVPESMAQKPSERVAADKQTITTLLDELGVEAGPSDFYRMGPKPNLAKPGPRLIKLIMPATKFRSIILGRWRDNRKTIQAINGLNRLLIRPSMTPDQLIEDRKKRAQRREQWQQNHPLASQNNGHPNVNSLEPK
jgi:hypothetical protein